MPSISQVAAETGLQWSNGLAIAGALLALAGAVGAFYFGRARDEYAAMAFEKEQSQRQALELKIQPRRLSDQQRTVLTEKIRAAKWKEAEVIWHGAGEPEIYARDLASTFEQAGATVHVHTLGPFIPQAWGLSVVETQNGDFVRLKAILDEAGVISSIASTNETLGEKDHPTLFVGTREDLGSPDNHDH
jgi:glycine/D-amino acid oxidase-like deaminating enzyme